MPRFTLSPRSPEDRFLPFGKERPRHSPGERTSFSPLGKGSAEPVNTRSNRAVFPSGLRSPQEFPPALLGRGKERARSTTARPKTGARGHCPAAGARMGAVQKRVPLPPRGEAPCPALDRALFAEH